MSSASLSTMKIVLYGPSNSGKTVFRLTLLGKSVDEVSPTEKTEEVETLRTVYKVKNGKKFPHETYRLKLADVPGKENASDERLSGLQKAIGILLFYDSTDPSSPEELKKMVENEIIAMGYLYNLLGIVIVGTKKDLGPNKEAVDKAQEFVNELSSQIKELWGYDVPHVLINAKNQEEANLTLSLLEHLMMSYTVPQEILEKIGVHTALKEVKIPSEKTVVSPIASKPSVSPIPKAEKETIKQLPEPKKQPEVKMPEVPSPETVISEKEISKTTKLDVQLAKEKPEIPPPEAGLEEAIKPEVTAQKLPHVPSPKEVLTEEKPKEQVKIPPIQKPIERKVSETSSVEKEKPIIKALTKPVLKVSRKKVSFKPIENKMIWRRLEEIAKRLDDVQKIILLKKIIKGDKQIVLYAYYAEMPLKEVPIELMNAIITIDELSEKFQFYSNIGKLQYILIQGNKNSIRIFKKDKSGIIYIETKGRQTPTFSGRLGF